jgi:hypothetical protein
MTQIMKSAKKADDRVRRINSLVATASYAPARTGAWRVIVSRRSSQRIVGDLPDRHAMLINRTVSRRLEQNLARQKVANSFSTDSGVRFFLRL